MERVHIANNPNCNVCFGSYVSKENITNIDWSNWWNCLVQTVGGYQDKRQCQANHSVKQPHIFSLFYFWLPYSNVLLYMGYCAKDFHIWCTMWPSNLHSVIMQHTMPALAENYSLKYQQQPPLPPGKCVVFSQVQQVLWEVWCTLPHSHTMFLNLCL